MEDAFVAAQEGRIRIRPEDVDVLLRGADLLGTLSQVGEADVAAWSSRHADQLAELGDRFRLLAQGQSASAAAAPSPGPFVAAPSPASPPVGRREVPIPREPLPRGDDYSMADLFREEVRAAALVLRDALPRLESEAHGAAPMEELAQAARAITGAARIVGVGPVARLGQTLEEVFSAAREGRARLDAGAAGPLPESTSLLAELIQVSDDDLPGWLSGHGADLDGLCTRIQALIGQQPTAPVQPPAPVAPPAPAEGANTPASATPAAEPSEAVVRVTAQSLNRLMGLAGESLVQARWLDPFSTALLKLKKQQDHLAGVLDGLTQALAAGGQDDRVESLVAEALRQSGQCREVLAERMREFQDHAAQAEDLNSRLYREVIASRMRPFADGAHGFPRLVRDMARRLGKEVRLEIEGQATEVDRDILENLEAPLTHLLRNAVDHGIEPPEQRRAAGKPETGLVRIEARHRAGMLAVTIADDGSGIDLERLRRKVVERGLTRADMARTMTEGELLEFLFLPGFSTASALTEYSGRGVGLDVVQTTVRKVGGSVRITTRPGRGTSFHLQLPITLSVLRAVLVDIGGEPYAFPHNRIDRLLYVPRGELRSLEQRQFVTVDGQNVGLVLASQLLDLPATPRPPTNCPCCS
jgi:two-component system sensor histidine kinase and response regulator WspE